MRQERRISFELSAEASHALKTLGARMRFEPPEVAPGQLWRAVWGDISLLGVVLSVEDGWAEFAPLTTDVEYADSHTAILAGYANLFPVTCAVFAGLTTPLPFFTLQTCLGAADDTVLEDLVQLWRDNLRGMAPKSQLPTGAPDLDGADEHRDYRLELTNQLGGLAAADFIGEPCRASTVDLPSAMKDAGLGPSALVSADIDLPAARAIAMGAAPVDASLAARIAELLGEDNPDVYVTDGPPVPAGLEVALNHPGRFSVVRAMAIEDGYDIPTTVRRLPAFAAARRRDQSISDEQFWIDVLDQMRRAL
jgi:hypothetical protein